MIVFIVLAVLLSGCGPGKMPVDIDMKAKQMAPPPGKALIYVYTTSKFAVKIYCSGRYIGRLGKDRYGYTILDPGIYDFAVDPDDTHQFRVELEGDKKYYVELQSEDGFVGPSFDFFRTKENVASLKMKRCGLSKELGDMLE
jgi:hypothetical protein